MGIKGNILNQRLDDDDDDVNDDDDDDDDDDNDDDDLRKKKGHFIGSVNKMFTNFTNVQSVVLTTLFK